MGRLLLAVPLVLLAGCGGGDGGGPTKEQFVSDANRICREGEAKIAEAAGEGAATSRGAIADRLEVTAEEYAPYLERLRELDAPAELESGWSRFLDGVGEAFDLIPQLADATRERDRNTLAELTAKFSQIAEDTRPFAQENGLSDCLPS
jgi:hypothetical protein